MTVKRYSQPQLDFDVEWHGVDCDCARCEPSRPSVEPRMGLRELGNIALAAMLVAHLIAAAIWGPATVCHILVATVTGRPL